MHDRCPRVLLRVRTEIRHSLHSMPARCPDGRARLSLSSSLRSERPPKTTKNCSRQETVPTADVQGWRRTVLSPAQLKQAEPHWRSMNGPGGTGMPFPRFSTLVALGLFASVMAYQAEPAAARRACGPANYGTPGCPYPRFGPTRQPRFKSLNTSCRQACTRLDTPAQRARCLRGCP